MVCSIASEMLAIGAFEVCIPLAQRYRNKYEVSWRQPAWRVVLFCAGVGGLPLN